MPVIAAHVVGLTVACVEAHAAAPLFAVVNISLIRGSCNGSHSAQVRVKLCLSL